MDEQFAVPDWGVEDIIENSPEYYFSQWCELMKDGDCVIAIQRRKANAIGRAMFSHGFSNADVHKTYNKARVACGLLPQVDFPAKTQPNKSVQRTGKQSTAAFNNSDLHSDDREDSNPLFFTRR